MKSFASFQALLPVKISKINNVVVNTKKIKFCFLMEKDETMFFVFEFSTKKYQIFKEGILFAEGILLLEDDINYTIIEELK